MAKTSKKPRNPTSKTEIKPYNIVNSSENEAEIDMYGDVYMDIPRDWWTDEPISGNFISAEKFLDDLEDLKDKDRITVHINSGGGDLYAGLAIYNRLKQLKGEVITVNDGIAASAASLIFQAGDIRRMNAASNFMAHGASGFLFGSYDVEDLETLVEQFKAHNKAVVNVYAERMGVEYEEAKDFVNGETWLTGQDAVDMGLADELIGEDEDEDEDSKNGFLSRVQAAFAHQYPQDVVMIPQTQRPVNVIKHNEIKKEEEPLIENVKELREAYPDLVKEIEDAAGKQAAKEERERIKEIEAIEATIADKQSVREAKFENPIDAKTLAFAAMQQQAVAGMNALADMRADAEASGAQNVAAAPSGNEAVTDEEKRNAEIARMVAQSDAMRGVR